MVVRLAALSAPLLTMALAACAAKQPISAAPAPDFLPRLQAADAGVRTGCFDCLVDSLRAYDAIATSPQIPPAIAARAAAGRVRSALLLAVRQRELGMAEDGYLEQAKEVAASTTEPGIDSAFVFTIVETIPRQPARSAGAAAAALPIAVYQELMTNRVAWLERLRGHADDDPLSAYLWLTFACTHGQSRLTPEQLVAPINELRTTPLISYRNATCYRADAQALTALLKEVPRYAEVEYSLGLAAVGRQQLDEAEPHFQRALDWHPRWPAADVALAGVYMTAEEADAALSLYDKALEMAPDHGEAAIGRVRALSHLGRHEQALAQVDDILTNGRWFAGEAYYWRAWNELQRDRVDAAWQSVEQAGRLWASADVSKLGGLIALRRKEVDVALARFQTAHGQSPNDCEIDFLLGTVRAELRHWTPSVDVFVETASCLDAAKRGYESDIARIQASAASAERKARRIAKREQQIATAARMQATSWFNTAVGCFNLARTGEAREYAEKVVADEQFGERARDLLSRIK